MFFFFSLATCFIVGKHFFLYIFFNPGYFSEPRPTTYLASIISRIAMKKRVHGGRHCAAVLFSLGNVGGRLAAGAASDFVEARLSQPRSVFLTLGAVLMGTSLAVLVRRTTDPILHHDVLRYVI